MRRFLALLGALWLGVALAQVIPSPGGIPPEWLPFVTVLIGYGSALLVRPATAIAKKLHRTQGVTTVAISAVLSVVIPLGFMVWQAAETRQEQSLWAALGSALIAFLKANGDYIGQVFANAKANQLAPPLAAPSSRPAAEVGSPDVAPTANRTAPVGTPVSVPPGFQPLMGRVDAREDYAPHDGEGFPSAVRVAERRS